MAQYKPLLRLKGAWKELLRQRTTAPAGSPDRVHLDVLYSEARPILEKLVESEREGEIILLCERALKVLREFDPKYCAGVTTGVTTGYFKNDWREENE